MLGIFLARWQHWRASFCGVVVARGVIAIAGTTNDSRRNDLDRPPRPGSWSPRRRRRDLVESPSGTVGKSAGQTQTNEINVAKQCATTCSPVRQCRIDPGCREEQLTCQVYQLGHGVPSVICREVTKCKEHCVELSTPPGLTESVP
jgi:hypothetical protein